MKPIGAEKQRQTKVKRKGNKKTKQKKGEAIKKLKHKKGGKGRIKRKKETT
jgi:hypothetical protein